MDKSEKRKDIPIKRNFDTEAAAEFSADGMLATSSKRHVRRFYISNENREKENEENQSNRDKI